MLFFIQAGMGTHKYIRIAHSTLASGMNFTIQKNSK